MTIRRHELPDRIVLTIGLVTSSLCVVGLIILWLGSATSRSSKTGSPGRSSST